MKNKKEGWIGMILSIMVLAVYARAAGTINTQTGDLIFNPASGKVLANGSIGVSGMLNMNGNQITNVILDHPQVLQPSHGNDTLFVVERSGSHTGASTVYFRDTYPSSGFGPTLQLYNARSDALKIENGYLNMNGNRITNAILDSPRVLQTSHGNSTLVFIERSGSHTGAPTVYMRDTYGSSGWGPTLQVYNARDDAIRVEYGYLNMNGNRIANVGKITYASADPMIKVGGKFYVTWAPESPAHEVTLSGTSKLKEGKKVIDFAGAPEGSKEWLYGKIAVNIRAFVTPLAPCLLYVSKQDNNGIVVESLDKKCESADFNWKVVGDRIDNVIGNSTLAPQDEVGNLSVAVDADLKEVIYRLPSDAEEEVVGYENILLENGSTKQKTITTKKPNKWEWIPKSKLKEHMKTYMEKSNTSP